MLSTMRKGVSTIFAKALILLLILSFGLWGVGDMLRGGGSQNLATVGKARVTPQEFNNRMERIKAQMDGMPLEMTQSEAFKMQVLQGMVQQLLLLQAAQDIGITVDKRTIAKVIADNPQFQNAEGRFDENMFRIFLDSNRVSEGMFIETIRRDVESATVLQTLDVPSTLNFVMLSHAIDASKRQSRSADIFIIPTVAAETAAPSDEILAEYYKTIQSGYMMPEERSISYVVINNAALESYIAEGISDDTVAERYATEKEHLGTPQKRDVVQFLFNDAQKAGEAAAKLREGAQTDAIERDFPLKNGEALVMKGITKASLPDAASGKVFALEQNGVSDPIETEFGWHVFKVAHITPSDAPSLEKASPQIRKTLISEGREDALYALSGKLEDAIAAGDSVENAAKKLEVDAQAFTITADATRVPTGDATTAEQIALKTGFTVGEGELSNFQSLNGKQYIVSTVTSITPESAKPLASVKADVLKRYNDNERMQATAQRAARIATALRDAEDAQSVATKERLVRRSFGPVTLGQALTATKDVNGVAPDLLRRMFDTELGAMTTPVRMADGSWALAKVTKITQAADAGESNSAADPELTGVVNNTVYANFLRHLTDTYPVNVNEALIREPAEQP